MIVFDPTIRERYATALFNVAKKQANRDELVGEVDELLNMFQVGSKVRLFLEGPQITTEDKQKLLENAFKGRVNPLFSQLFGLLLAKGRIEYIQPVLQRFKTLVERDRGIYEATVSTAVSLDDGQKKELKSALEKYTGNTLKINFLVEPGLIGGVRFIYGDVLIDDTVKGKLYRLRQSLESAARV